MVRSKYGTFPYRKTVTQGGVNQGKWSICHVCRIFTPQHLYICDIFARSKFVQICYSSRVSGYELSPFLGAPDATITPLKQTVKRIKTRGGRKGLRWCGFALFLVRFCGNFYFNSRYCGFKTLSGLRLLQPLSRGFRWKKKCLRW